MQISQTDHVKSKEALQRVEEERDILHTGQAMYVYVTLRRVRATIVGLKAISIIYSECVSVALLIQHAMRMRHIAICSLSGSTSFFHIILYMAGF
jgi:hypothetical protein